MLPFAKSVARDGARIVLIIAAMLLVSSCGSLGTDRGLTREAAALLGDAAKLRFPEAVPVLFQIGEEARALGDYPKAQAAVDRLRAFPLEPQDKFRADLLAAHILFDRKQPENALLALDTVGLPPTPADRVRVGELRARALEALRRFTEAAEERSRIHPLLAPSARAANANALLDALGNLTPADLAAVRTADRVFLPWVELANLLYGGDALDRQIERYRTWESRWGNTIATADLPNVVREMTRMDAARPDRVALLLPASGTLAGPARAVRDGFMAAMMSPGVRRPEVASYDVQSGGVVAAYDRAVADGMQLVIGPLDKQDVARLNSRASLPVPVLALNYLPEGASARRGLYQFGLAPEDEGEAIADYAKRTGKTNVLLLHTRADWSARAATAFTARWQAAGLRIAQTAILGDIEALSGDLGAALAVVDPAQRRASIGTAFGLSAGIENSGVDAVVLLLRASEAAMVAPSLRTYVDRSTPILASSHINSASSTIAAELQGIVFCDTPWRIHGDPLRTRVARNWPAANGESGNLYALGADAFYLHDRLALFGRRGAALDGFTGVLALEDNSRFVRTPVWARFTDRGATAPLESAGGGR